MIGARIAECRNVLGHSQRGFAIALGIDCSVLSRYEKETSVPGGIALKSLCNMGFDINWILTGEGAMWRKRDLATANDNNSEVLDLLEHLGLQKPLIAAMKAGQGKHVAIVQALVDRVMTPAALAKDLRALGTKASTHETATDLAFLAKSGIVDQRVRGRSVFYGPSRMTGLRATSQLEMGQMAIKSVTFLGRDIIPAVIADPQKGGVFCAEVRVSADAARETWATLKAAGLALAKGDGATTNLETATLVMGLAVYGRSKA